MRDFFKRLFSFSDRIQTRIILLLCIIALFLVLDSVLINLAQREKIKTLVNAQVEVNRQLLSKVLSATGKRMEAFMLDYSLSYDVGWSVLSGDINWAQKNLPSAFNNYQLQAVWLYRTNFQLVFSYQSLATAIKPDQAWISPFLSNQANTTNLRGWSHYFLQTEWGLLEIRGSPIYASTDSKREGDPRGFLFSGRLWTEQRLAEISELTTCEVKLLNEPFDRKLFKKDSSVVSQLDLLGPDDKKVAELEMLNFSSFQTGLAALPLQLLINQILFSLVLFSLITVLLFKMIRHPLALISKSLTERNADIIEPLKKDRALFGRIAELIAESFQQKDKLEEEIAERKKAETLFKELNVELENRVAERTFKLQDTVSQLKEEIKERKMLEERFVHLAYHDVLTGLPNRTLLKDRMEQALFYANRNAQKVGIIFLDLDRFKSINDSLGHHIGDQLLKIVSARIKKCVRSSDTVCRQGGDEFIVLAPGIKDAADIHQLASQIHQHLAEMILIDDHEITITPSIGFSVYPHDGLDMDTLVKHADTAMYQAKAGGRNAIKAFDSGMQTQLTRSVQLEQSFRQAIERNEFKVYYQPQIDILTGEIAGAEALVRWHQPRGQIVSPLEFIPIAESSGYIHALGELVLWESCRQNKTWQREGLPAFPISVNLSPEQFRSQNLEEMIYKVLKQTDLDPRYLHLEITESSLMNSPESVKHLLKKFRDIGIELSIDDFGTGYSSLSYLRHYPFNKLKIDRSFIRDIPHNAEDTAITGAIIRMAKHLKLRVVAEGVETIEQVHFLKEQFSDQIQGFYYSRPLSAADFKALLLEKKSYLI
jgi:diguanylate cyclase (GGDEF)-like protein